MEEHRIVFPQELESHPERPIIHFNAVNRTNNEKVNIFLPSPQGITFNDGADYSSIDLGVVGGSINEIAQAETFGEAKKQIKSIQGGQVLDILLSKGPQAEMARFARKTVVNPNTNTTFTNNRIRTFNFNFKMVASSEKESKTIRNIHTAFRRYTYAASKADGNNLTLSFPPVWNIRFVDFKAPDADNPYIPKIKECYLTQVEAVFNADSNIFYNDQAPLSVTVSLTFQETRTLTRKDIENLEKEQMGDFSGLDKNGLPSLEFPNIQKKFDKTKDRLSEGFGSIKNKVIKKIF